MEITVDSGREVGPGELLAVDCGKEVVLTSVSSSPPTVPAAAYES